MSRNAKIITGIAAALLLLCIGGAIVTFGALGCRIEIASAAPYDLVKGWVAPILDELEFHD